MKKTTFRDKLKLNLLTVRLLTTKELKEAVGGDITTYPTRSIDICPPSR